MGQKHIMVQMRIDAVKNAGSDIRDAEIKLRDATAEDIISKRTGVPADPSPEVVIEDTSEELKNGFVELPQEPPAGEAVIPPVIKAKKPPFGRKKSTTDPEGSPPSGG